MATALKIARSHSPQHASRSRVHPHSHSPFPALSTHMVINILSSHQSSVAVQFSRPDLHPHPFKHMSYRLTEEGLPVLEGSLGALSCKLVAASWPLHDLEELGRGRERRDGDDAVWEGEGVASELFIAEVKRVEVMDAGKNGEEARTPLLYHRRTYATTHEIPPSSYRTSKS